MSFLLKKNIRFYIALVQLLLLTLLCLQIRSHLFWYTLSLICSVNGIMNPVWMYNSHLEGTVMRFTTQCFSKGSHIILKRHTKWKDIHNIFWQYCRNNDSPLFHFFTPVYPIKWQNRYLKSKWNSSNFPHSDATQLWWETVPVICKQKSLFRRQW